MLSNLSAWWKSPPLFNDPFDTQLQLNLGCDANSIVDAMASRVEALIFSEEALASGMDEGIKRAILDERARAQPKDRDKVAEGLRIGLQPKLPEIRKALDDAQRTWLRWLDRMRVFCVSEVKDDILMWSHYADRHRGAVLELRPLQGERGALREAIPIRYTPEIPGMASAEEWADHLLGEKPLDFDRFFHAFAFSKSEHWRYEREWRCRIVDADPSRDIPDMPLVWPCPLQADEVVAIHLGCRMADPDRSALLDVARARVSSAEVYEAVKSRTRFALDFRRLR